MNKCLRVGFFGFYGISTLVGYLMLNPVHTRAHAHTYIFDNGLGDLGSIPG